MLEAANSSLALLPPEKRKHILGQDERARKIAKAGQQWKKTIGRTLDMEGASFLVHIPSLTFRQDRQTDNCAFSVCV